MGPARFELATFSVLSTAVLVAQQSYACKGDVMTARPRARWLRKAQSII